MPRPELVCYACARVDSSKVGRWSVPRLETMTSQEVFRQVPEHTNHTKFAIQGGGFRPKYYRVSRHLLPSMCTFLWQLFYDYPVLLQVSPEGGEGGGLIVIRLWICNSTRLWFTEKSVHVRIASTCIPLCMLGTSISCHHTSNKESCVPFH